jgi:uncharacterized membrane-anchored protein YjiN (DUF445 family)
MDNITATVEIVKALISTAGSSYISSLLDDEKTRAKLIKTIEEINKKIVELKSLKP